MYYLVLAVVALAWAFCSGTASAFDRFGKELVQNFETCVAQFPPALADADLTWATESTHWYVTYTDEIYFNRVSDIFLTGKENSPLREVRNFFDSPCLTDRNEPYIPGKAVSENLTTLGITIPLATTLQSTGVVNSVYHLPNTQIPAVTLTLVPSFTDGQTYVIVISCLPEGYRGFQVFSSKPALDSYSIHQIKEYLNNAGFDDKLSAVTTYRASTCSNVP